MTQNSKHHVRPQATKTPAAKSASAKPTKAAKLTIKSTRSQPSLQGRIVQRAPHKQHNTPARSSAYGIKAELLGITAISMGFTSWRNEGLYKLTVIEGNHLTMVDRTVLAQVPSEPGIYIWCARAPDGGKDDWFAIYLGKAKSLQARFKQYVNTDGTFGPKNEKHKRKVLQEMIGKGFDLQIRWRPKTSASRLVGEDELRKLGKYNFPLNDQDNAGYREVEVPGAPGFFGKGPPRHLSDFPYVRRQL